VLYKFTQKYDKDSQSGIYAFDQQLNIDWAVKEQSCILSNKDRSLGSLKQYLKFKDII